VLDVSSISPSITQSINQVKSNQLKYIYTVPYLMTELMVQWQKLG